MHTIRNPWWTALAAFLLASVLMPSAAQAARETRTPGDFQAIVSHGAFDLRVQQADRVSVELEAEEAMLAQIETVVETSDRGAVLHIRPKSGVRWPWRWGADTAPKVRVAMPRLTGVTLRGSGDLKLEPFTTPELALSVVGSGDVRFNKLATDRLSVAISGSGDVRGDGKSEQVKLSIAGSGDARLGGLVAQSVEVKIAGSGNAEVFADQQLNISIAGSGDVRHGGAATPNTSIAGGGRVRRSH